MNIMEMMAQLLITIGLIGSFSDIEELFINNTIRHILVVEEGELFSQASERNLLRATNHSPEVQVCLTRYLAALKQHVLQIAILKSITLNISASIARVIYIFKINASDAFQYWIINNRLIGVITTAIYLNISLRFMPLIILENIS